MPSHLRLGLLGTGVAARRLYLPALAKVAKFVKVTVCCNRSREKAEAFSRALGGVAVVDSAEQLLAHPDVDAVLISLPIAVQPRFVRAALLAGKPVLSEKPIAPTLAEARKLLTVAKRCPVPWLVGENFAFMSHVERVERWLTSGRVGNVRLVEARQISWMDEKNPYFHTAWRQLPEHAGGFVVDGGVHLANIVRRCFGMPVRVRSLTASFNPLLPPVDTAVAALQFESGALGTWISCFSAHPRPPLLQIHGTRGHVAVGYDFAELTELSGKQTRVAGNDSFAAQFKHFADVVKKGVAPRVTPEQALDDLRLVHALLDAR